MTQPAGKSSASTVAEQAADWIIRRDRGLTASECEAFTRWQSLDPRHAAEFERLARTWSDLDVIAANPGLEMLADDMVARAHLRRARRNLPRAVTLSFAAAAAVVVGVASWVQRSSIEHERPSLSANGQYRVLASTAQRTILPDGSTAELNGASRIEVEFTPSERRVQLVEGEAHFIVTENPTRPFLVTAGSVSVRAVGTAFNVRLSPGSVEVLVTEGKVELNTPATSDQLVASSETAAASALVQGQRAVVSLDRPASAPSVAIGEVGQTEMDDALGWQSTRLVFSNTPLDEVVQGFNQYNSRRLMIGDSKLKQRTLTGIFRADNLDGFVRLLKASVDVRAERRTADEIVLLPLR